MSAAWVGGSVRAAAMSRRRLGSAQIGRIATVPDVADAIEVIARSPYGHDVVAGDSVSSETQRGIAATLLWNMHVLAGWLPPAGASMLRTLAGWFEIANIDEHLSMLSGAPATIRPFRVGRLATAWSRLALAGSLAELLNILDASAWGDPGADEPGAIEFYGLLGSGSTAPDAGHADRRTSNRRR